MPCGCAAKLPMGHQWVGNGPGLVIRSLTTDPSPCTCSNTCSAHIHGQVVVVCVYLVHHGLLLFTTALSVHKGLHSASCIADVVPTTTDQHCPVRDMSDEGKVSGAGTFRKLLLSAGCGDVICYGSTDEGAGIHSLTRLCTHKQHTHTHTHTAQCVHTYYTNITCMYVYCVHTLYTVLHACIWHAVNL